MIGLSAGSEALVFRCDVEAAFSRLATTSIGVPVRERRRERTAKFFLLH